MTLALIAAIFIAGWFALEVHWHQNTIHDLEDQIKHLVRLQTKAHKAMTQTRTRPAPEHWGPRPFDRLIDDMGLTPLPDPPSLSLVTPEAAGREAHSHATKGSEAS